MKIFNISRDSSVVWVSLNDKYIGDEIDVKVIIYDDNNNQLYVTDSVLCKLNNYWYSANNMNNNLFVRMYNLDDVLLQEEYLIYDDNSYKIRIG